MCVCIHAVIISIIVQRKHSTNWFLLRFMQMNFFDRQMLLMQYEICKSFSLKLIFFLLKCIKMWKEFCSNSLKCCQSSSFYIYKQKTLFFHKKRYETCSVYIIYQDYNSGPVHFMQRYDASLHLCVHVFKLENIYGMSHIHTHTRVLICVCGFVHKMDATLCTGMCVHTVRYACVGSCVHSNWNLFI